jgi:hypothetical protein
MASMVLLRAEKMKAHFEYQRDTDIGQLLEKRRSSWLTRSDQGYAHVTLGLFW